MDWTYNILGPDPAAGLMVVLILVIIEGVLSVDNAAVLATMVMRLPEHQRGKALKYGIIGDRKSTRLNSSHITRSRMPSSA